MPKSRRLVRCTAISPAPIAFPSRLAPRRSSNISGNRVTSSKVSRGASTIAAVLGPASLLAVLLALLLALLLAPLRLLPDDLDGARAGVDRAHELRHQRDQQLVGGCARRRRSGALDHHHDVVGTVPEGLAHHTQPLAVL